MGDDEAEYVQRVVPHGYEGWVSKTEDNNEDGCRAIPDDKAPVDGDGPVIAGGDDEVEVAS